MSAKEYHILQYPSLNTLQLRLNHLASVGWEAVGSANFANGVYYQNIVRDKRATRQILDVTKKVQA